MKSTVDTRNLLITAAVLLLILIGAYANHFNNTFHFDDSHAVVDNLAIRNLQNIPQYYVDPSMFSSDPPHYGLRPVVTTTLAIDYWLGGGLDPFYFQLSTFIWHILLCCLLFFIYRKLLNVAGAPWVGHISIIATGWFAIHTANAETLNYIISRSDVLSTFFILLSFCTFVQWPQLRKYYLYIIPAVIGVLCKETVPVLLIILFFYVLLFEKKVSLTNILKPSNLKIALRVFIYLLPLTLAVLLVQLYTLSKITDIPGITNPWLYYVLTQSYVWLHYFISFFLPLNLSADTDWTVITNPFDERIILGLAFVTTLVVAIFKTSSKETTRPISLGLIWFCASLLPTSLAPFAEVTNDHRMYFAFTGLSLSVTYYLVLKFKGAKHSLPLWLATYGPMAIIVIVFALNAFGVHQRNKVWHSEESLWYDVTIKSPNNGRGLMNYGLTQMSKGAYDTAEQYFNKALKFLPNYSSLYINLGVVNASKGLDEKAEQYFNQAIHLAPLAFDGYTFYSRYLFERGRYAQAVEKGEKALSINPRSQLTLAILLQSYNAMGNWEKSTAIAQNILTLLPNDAMAMSYLDAASRKEIIVKPATSPTNVQSETPEAYLDQSLVFYNAGEYRKCIETAEQALRLRADYADAYSNIGAAYNKLGELHNGIAACEKALAINPTHSLAKGNLEWAKSMLQAQH